MRILTPTVGQDYKTAKEARQAYQDNADFILKDSTSRWNGKPVNRKQLNGEQVLLRFCDVRKTTLSK